MGQGQLGAPPRRRGLPVALPSPSTEMSWMAKRRMMVQIMPSVIFALPSTISGSREGKKATPSAPRRAARLDPTAQLMPRARGSGPCRGWAGSSGSPHAAPKSLPPCASDASSRRQGSRRGALAELRLLPPRPGIAAPAGTRSAAGHRRLQSREPRCAATLLRLARQGQPLPNGAEQRRAPARGAVKSPPEPRGRPRALPAAS